MMEGSEQRPFTSLSRHDYKGRTLVGKLLELLLKAESGLTEGLHFDEITLLVKILWDLRVIEPT